MRGAGGVRQEMIMVAARGRSPPLGALGGPAVGLAECWPRFKQNAPAKEAVPVVTHAVGEHRSSPAHALAWPVQIEDAQPGLGAVRRRLHRPVLGPGRLVEVGRRPLLVPRSQRRGDGAGIVVRDVHLPLPSVYAESRLFRRISQLHKHSSCPTLMDMKVMVGV